MGNKQQNRFTNQFLVVQKILKRVGKKGGGYKRVKTITLTYISRLYNIHPNIIIISFSWLYIIINYE